MGGGFCIKAVTRYAVLADVFLFFLFSDKKTCFKKFTNFFFVLGEGQRGIKGVNARAQNTIALSAHYKFC